MESADLARRLWRPAVVALAGAAALIPVPTKLVDRFYSAGIYPRLQSVLTTSSNLVPLAALDVLILLVAAAFVGLAWRDARAGVGPARVLMRILGRGVLFSAFVYLAFLTAWGLNYRRVPLVDALPFEPAAVTPDAAKQALAVAVEHVNALHDAAHAAGWPAANAIDQQLVDGLWRAVRDLGRGATIVPARPKQTLLDWYFRKAAVDGMTDPLLL